MTREVISVGQKLHIITRRNFSEDLRRHFVGEITGVDGELCEVQGYSFVFDPFKNDYVRYPDVRVRVFNVGHAGLIVNKMPPDVDVATLRYRMTNDRLVVTDMADYQLEINEFGIKS